ncbi:IucA/IucC family protein [Streptomyces sp. NPDC047315]|uniref:IucA/IucC family protein n=1 Tax=Streptomyces sp. NPDC047315 TaxID=3155142 RepID=UPI0033FE20A1
MLNALSALLREDAAGLRSRTTRVDLPDGTWLRLPTDDDALLLPVRRTEPGFQHHEEARLPLLRRESDGTVLTGCDEVLHALRALADPRDRAGYDAFAQECREATAAARQQTRTTDAVHRDLVTRYGADPARWNGPGASLAFDALAARLDHPVYPTARGRAGLTSGELREYAPEFHPCFRLRWLALPRDAVALSGTPDEQRPDAWRWPKPSEVDLPDHLDASHLALPVHPLTATGPLTEALRATGLADRAHLAKRPHLDVFPTLSLRTVALADRPTVHLKLPLATATLGRLNRRTIKPGTLADGAAVQRLLAAVVAREPRFQGVVLLADETHYAHADHELIAALARHQPADPDATSTAVPLAALLAPAPGGGLVIDRLADRHHRGDVLALLDTVLTLLFDWQTTLFGHGIALESHQQNVTLLLGGAGPRLVFKDNDGPRIHAGRARAALGAPLPDFADRRIVVDDDRALIDLFTTITVHLCAGAFAFALARTGHAPLNTLLALVRDRLADAVARLDAGPRTALRTHVLDAAHLPVKAMVTAGTLLAKERSGALDINKHYTTGPNYLLPGSDER